jgi:hypothetical protein
MSTKILEYVSQPNNYTCQSAAIARVLGTDDVMSIRDDLETIGEPGDPAVMGIYLKSRVTEYKYNGDASLDDMIAAIKAGYQLIVHGWFTKSGHVIGFSSWDGKYFNSEDPWAEFDFGSWSYPDTEATGDDKPYSALGVYAACIAGQSCYDAADVYQAGKVDYKAKGCWLHMIRN